MTIITRVAPSPTGMMHIGTARTALFNWLLARRSGGKFLLRIEDTDTARSNPDAVSAIFDGLNWLGLDYDGDVVYQGSNSARHAEIATALLDKGLAYRCFLTPDEAASLKLQGQAFRSPYRDPTNITDTSLLRRLHDGSPSAIRFKGPTDGDVVIDDLVRGRVVFSASNFDDLVLVRSNGQPTYNLAVVVDDHDMGVNHVIRGDDHLSNAGRQALIIDAMGWNRPVYGHIPLIFDVNGKKLSKRSGTAVALSDYRDAGYTADAVFNYLCRLGWGGSGQEVFNRDYAVSKFNIADVVASPARVDDKKLRAIAVHHFNKVSSQDMANEFGTTAEIVDLLRDGAATKRDVLGKYEIFAASDPTKIDDPASKTIVGDLIRALGGVAWDKDSLTSAIREFTVTHPMKVVGPVTRQALLGVSKAPDLPTCLTIIGRDTSLARMAWSIV